jgi:glutathione S-transferase
VSGIILHQYDNSPFSEKVRVCLGIKGLEWQACDQPVIMPKPDLIPLTGGYRRIPVMQIGADIWCDSQLIVRELERRFPTPTLFPAGDNGLASALQRWTDIQVFGAAVAVIFAGIGDAVPEAFRKDREAMSGRPFDPAAMAAAVPIMAEQLRAHLSWVDDALADGRPFLTGDKPGLADAAAYYNPWFIRNANPAAAHHVDAFPRIRAWEQRVTEIGHGRRSETTSADAIAVAAAATPATREGVEPGEPNGLEVGQKVFVMADDYGRDPIAGELVAASAQEVVIRRSSERTGEVMVHFPRAGFIVGKAG